MNRVLYSTSGLIALAAAFLSFSILNNLFLGSVRIDLTENKLFTLSDGSKEIIDGIDEPINLYFFFSQRASEDLTAIRTYARRVREFLEEYELYGDGRINLQVIDPEPFSEEEELASEFGLQGVPVNTSGDELFFGLAATNALDDQAVLSFFQPDKEEFLEYDISKLIYSLTDTTKAVIGLMSSLKIQRDIDMSTFQSTPAWMIVDQIEQTFEVETLDSNATEIPDNIDVLMLVHPKQLADDTLYAIDQFVMKGGRLLAFVDPLAELDRPPQANPMMPAAPRGQASDLNKLMTQWGVTLKENSILGDAQSALSVGGGQGRTPVRHLGILGFGAANFSSEDVITSALESINVATAGILEVSEDKTTEVTALIESSVHSMGFESFQFQFLTDPADLQRGFSATGEKYLVAARITGPAESAFPDGLPGTSEDAEVVAASESINVIVVADTDILSDRLWVQVQNFFGRRIATPWSNNGDFVINALDNLTGSSALISIRSRGRFSRPFEVVQDLKRQAEARYLQNANDLQARLSETENKLRELQDSKEEQNLLTLSPEQEAAIVEFQQEKLRIRKELRNVRHGLDQDIENLGTALKFINIALMPILMTLLVLALYFVRMNARPSRD